MAYFFTPHVIFLCGEDKDHKCGDGEFIIGGGCSIEYVRPTLKVISDSEMVCCQILCLCNPLAAGEEKGNYDHVRDGLQLLIIGGCGHAGYPAQDLDWYWLHPRRRWVLPVVAAEL